MKTKILTLMFAVLLIGLVQAEVFQTPGYSAPSIPSVNPADVFTIDDEASFFEEINWLRLISLIIGVCLVLFTLIKSIQILTKKLKRKRKSKDISNPKELTKILNNLEKRNNEETIKPEVTDMYDSIVEEPVIKPIEKTIKIEKPEEMNRLIERISKKEEIKEKENEEFKEVLDELGINDLDERMKGWGK